MRLLIVQGEEKKEKCDMPYDCKGESCKVTIKGLLRIAFISILKTVAESNIILTLYED